MNTDKGLTAFITAAMLVSSILSGCAGGSASSSNVTTKTLNQTDSETENSSDYSNSTIFGRVTAVNDNEITLALMPDGDRMREDPNGTPPTDFQNEAAGSEESGQMPPERPDQGEQNNDAPNADSGQTPPERPDQDGQNNDAPNAGSGQTPPERPDQDGQNNDAPNADSGQTPPERPDTDNRQFETVIITITDESVLKDITLSDITEGTFLSVTFGDNNTLTSVERSDMQNRDGQRPGDGQTDDFDQNHSPEGPGGMNGGTVDTGTGATTITANTEETDQTYSSQNEDENALRIEGAVTYSGTSLSVSKTGDTSSSESSDFYGLNAGILSLDGANTTITDSVISTDAKGANGIFAYGSDTDVTISNSSITTFADNSGGLDVTGGATLTASNLNITTSGNSSAAIRSDRGGGNLTVSKGTYTTNGTGSPAIYSTADITVSDATLNATSSEGVVIEGKNSVTLNNCDLTGNMQGTYQGDDNENLQTIMIYQSMSGDADEGEGTLTINGGSITGLNGDLIYSTNTTSVLNLNNVALTLANDVLLRVSGNNSSRGWGTAGSNGADMKFNAANQQLNGKIIVDDISSLSLTLSENSYFEGSINEEQEDGTVTVTMDDTCKWKLTADSYITSLDGDMNQIDTNGFTLYINGIAQN